MDSRIRVLMAETGLRKVRNGQEPQEHDPRDNPEGLPIQPIHWNDENYLRKRRVSKGRTGTEDIARTFMQQSINC